MNEAPGLEKESRYEQKQKESSGSFSGNRNGSCYGNSAGTGCGQQCFKTGNCICKRFSKWYSAGNHCI